MGLDCVGKSIERVLQSADDVLEPTSWNSGRLNPLDAFNKSLQAFVVNWHRALSSKASSKDAELACAKTWINAFFEIKLALRIEILLINVREKVAAATSGGERTRESRCAPPHPIKWCLGYRVK